MKTPKPDISLNQRSFEVNWTPGRSSGSDSGELVEPVSAIDRAWTELAAITQAEYGDFPPLHAFVAWMESEMPESWDWNNPKVILFLERLDQLEDLGWALDLQRAQGS
jgi:hypothetical protein